jgi:hypothetical protein
MRTTFIALSLVAVSCFGTWPNAAPDADAIVLDVEFSGGCAQLGPNCAQLIVFGDGTVVARRILPGGTERVDSGSIDTALVNALHQVVADTDLAALHRRLPEGECRGCYDGIDTTLRFSPASSPAFASVDVELESSEPVFQAAFAVLEAAQLVVEIPVVAR